MSKPCGPNEPFEALIQQIQDAMDYTDHGGAPFTQEQILNTAYNLVYQAGVFVDDCKDWRNRRAPLAKDWPEFKRFFCGTLQQLGRPAEDNLLRLLPKRQRPPRCLRITTRVQGEDHCRNCQPCHRNRSRPHHRGQLNRDHQQPHRQAEELSSQAGRRPGEKRNPLSR